jgi:hypothetical protein
MATTSLTGWFAKETCCFVESKADATTSLTGWFAKETYCFVESETESIKNALSSALEKHIARSQLEQPDKPLAITNKSGNCAIQSDCSTPHKNSTSLPDSSSDTDLPARTRVKIISTHSSRKGLKNVILTVVRVSLRHPQCSAFDLICCQMPDGTTKDFVRHSIKRL